MLKYFEININQIYMKIHLNIENNWKILMLVEM